MMVASPLSTEPPSRTVFWCPQAQEGAGGPAAGWGQVTLGARHVLVDTRSRWDPKRHWQKGFSSLTPHVEKDVGAWDLASHSTQGPGHSREVLVWVLLLLVPVLTQDLGHQQPAPASHRPQREPFLPYIQLNPISSGPN